MPVARLELAPHNFSGCCSTRLELYWQNLADAVGLEPTWRINSTVLATAVIAAIRSTYCTTLLILWLHRLDSNQQDLTEDGLTIRCSTYYAYCGSKLLFRNLLSFTVFQKYIKQDIRIELMTEDWKSTVLPLN